MHDYGYYCSLSWPLPVFLLAFICTEYDLYSCIQLPKTKHAICVHHTYLYVVFNRHSKVKFSCATFKTFKNITPCFVYFIAHGKVVCKLLW